MIIINNKELYKFQISNKYYDRFLKLLLRSYTNLFNNLTIIKEDYIAKQFNIKTSEVIRILLRLEQLEIIKYQPSNNNAQITFLKQRTDSDNLNIDLRRWQRRKMYEQQKLDDIAKFALCTNKCRSSILLNYFGEKNIANCNKCDYCIKKKRQDLKDKEFKNISKSLQHILTTKELTLNEIHNLLPELKKDSITYLLEFLFENDKISKFGNKYKWKTK